MIFFSFLKNERRYIWNIHTSTYIKIRNLVLFHNSFDKGDSCCISHIAINILFWIADKLTFQLFAILLYFLSYLHFIQPIVKILETKSTSIFTHIQLYYQYLPPSDQQKKFFFTLCILSIYVIQISNLNVSIFLNQSFFCSLFFPMDFCLWLRAVQHIYTKIITENTVYRWESELKIWIKSNKINLTWESAYIHALLVG